MGVPHIINYYFSSSEEGPRCPRAQTNSRWKPTLRGTPGRLERPPKEGPTSPVSDDSYHKSICPPGHGRGHRLALQNRAAARHAPYTVYTLILGAWGCGVFGNRPQVVADLWSEVLDTLEWRGRFGCIVFAVPHGVHGHSLAAFRRALRPLAP